MLNVVTSVDGSTVVDGVSGPLGTPADKLVFSALRACTDVILAGSNTVTAENYRPPRTSEEQRSAREQRGQRPKPRIAVVSGSLSFPTDLELFSDPAERPIVLTTEDAPPERLRAVDAVADVIQAGHDGEVDLASALAALQPECDLVLCEGGSTLNGHLVAAGLVDEVDVSISAVLAGGHGPRLASGAGDVLQAMTLAHLWEEDGMLLARYVADRSAT